MARFPTLFFTILAVALLNVSLTLGAAARKAPVAELLQKCYPNMSVPVLVLYHPKVLSVGDSTIPIETFAISFF
jgi:hypothetical protein